MAQEAKVQHTTPTEATTHPPGTMVQKTMPQKRAKKAAAEARAASAAEHKALKIAAEASPPGGAKAAAPGGAEAAAALAPTIAVDDTAVDPVDEDEAPLTLLDGAKDDNAPLLAPAMDTDESGEDGQQQSPETQAPEACPPPLPTTTPTSRSSL